MSEHWPKIRLHLPPDRTGTLLIRDSLSISFYMHKPHPELAGLVVQSLDKYVSQTGARLEECIHYSDHVGDWFRVDDARWARIRNEVLNDPSASLNLNDESIMELRHGIEYRGLSQENVADYPDAVSAMRLWLPTEYLEEHGPDRVRAFALDLLGSLPICSGNVGLAFHGDWDTELQRALFNELVFRYPGMDVIDLRPFELGTLVNGVSWMTLLGQPALGEVGGIAALRARLRSPGTTVEELEGDRAVITLGTWPDSGDTREGRLLPSYRELAKVLEPVLYRTRREHWRWLFDSPADLHRWERRFLE